ncbi:MAG: Flp pilus assembly protein CpaB [Terracidiphilus sp.]|nr:Flp pilus assembly protein CpaB [Terracidiphilus sp.]MDR3798746.1 Flp pilus assembly protein CpaB [Terracidiphilus sp.]
MNRRLLTILVVALVVASLCTWLVIRLVGVRLAASKPMATTQVVAAAKDIPLGAVITKADLTTITLGGSAPKGAILKMDDAVGRGVISEIYQGEPILESRLAGVGSGGGLAPTIPQGMRACAVRVDEVVGVAGFVIPGSRVDVLVSGNPPNAGGNSGGVQTQTLLQNIQVLSAGTDIAKDAEGKPQQVQVVNLLVTPEQAETLSLASNSLKIQLVLRNPLDTQMAKVPPTAMNTIFTSTAPPPAAPRRATGGEKKPVPKTYSITISNGSKTTESKFATPEGQH